PIASTRPICSPLRPPTSSPPNSKRPLSSPSNSTVLTEFITASISLYAKPPANVRDCERQRAVSHERLAHLHFNLPRLGDFLLRKGDRQRPVLVIRFHGFGIHGLRHGEHPLERPVGTLHAMPTALFLLGLELTLAANRQRTVFQAYIDILHFHVRNVGFHDEL